jgi:hypothetical protein
METVMPPEIPVLELVSFHLIPGTPPATFVAMAQATEPVLRRQPGYVSHRLVHTADGQWIDIVEWQSLAHATEAAKIVLADPAIAPFVAAIDMATVTMSHPALAWRMD